jgi:hypothetical protein
MLFCADSLRRYPEVQIGHGRGILGHNGLMRRKYGTFFRPLVKMSFPAYL